MKITLDGAKMTSRAAAHEHIAAEMAFPEWYGKNLDALWDILTGLPHNGKRFSIIHPENADDSLKEYASLMESVFREAGALSE